MSVSRFNRNQLEDDVMMELLSEGKADAFDQQMCASWIKSMHVEHFAEIDRLRLVIQIIADKLRERGFPKTADIIEGELES